MRNVHHLTGRGRLEVPGGAFCIRKWLMSADRSLARSLCVQVPGTSQFQYRRRF
jgi:hypothetical protein